MESSPRSKIQIVCRWNFRELVPCSLRNNRKRPFLKVVSFEQARFVIIGEGFSDSTSLHGFRHSLQLAYISFSMLETLRLRVAVRGKSSCSFIIPDASSMDSCVTKLSMSTTNASFAFTILLRAKRENWEMITEYNRF